MSADIEKQVVFNGEELNVYKIKVKVIREQEKLNQTSQIEGGIHFIKARLRKEDEWIDELDVSELSKLIELIS